MATLPLTDCQRLALMIQHWDRLIVSIPVQPTLQSSLANARCARGRSEEGGKVVYILARPNPFLIFPLLN
jgi:hypothetical protein